MTDLTVKEVALCSLISCGCKKLDRGTCWRRCILSKPEYRICLATLQKQMKKITFTIFGMKKFISFGFCFVFSMISVFFYRLFLFLMLVLVILYKYSLGIDPTLVI